MSVSRSSSLGSRAAVCLALLSLVQCVSTSSPPDLRDIVHGDFVQFGEAPDTVKSNTSVQVEYLCSRACKVGLEVVLSTPERNGIRVFRRSWTSRQLGKRRVRGVVLVWPASLIYKRDFFVRRSVDAHDVMLRAWLDHIDHRGDEGGNTSTGAEYHGSLVRTFKFLRTVPSPERPAQPQTRSLSWWAELSLQLSNNSGRQCPSESEFADLLTFPLASTGERFGVIRTFKPFINRELERERRDSIHQPSMAVSVWLYLLGWCGDRTCGILNHVTDGQTFGTPLLMLSPAGYVIVQARLASSGEQAFTAQTAIPLRTWTRLDLHVLSSVATLKIRHTAPGGELVESVHTYSFQGALMHNDTSGYFIIGGSSFMPGIHGYIGPIRYYRLGSERVVNPLSPSRTVEELDRTHRRCSDMRRVLLAFLEQWRTGRDTSTQRELSGRCASLYEELKARFGPRVCRQSWSWEQQRRHRTILRLLQAHQEELTTGGPAGHWSGSVLERFGRVLFEDVLERMVGVGGLLGAEPMPSALTEQLEAASCCGHHPASLLLATGHFAGLGLPVDLEQGHVYGLMGAVEDDRLALLHMGYKHMLGLDGLPRDLDVACSYYANMGRQTSADFEREQDLAQYTTEHVHLSEDEEVASQMSETGDVVQYLTHQAQRGDMDSQKLLARMLFWGQNGVAKDVGAAVGWYARSAMQMTDATSMYDYAILLLKGTGVEKNTTLGRKLLEKAAAMGSKEALNGLGWYYCHIEADERRAVQYFALAAQNGSRDGMFNLGVFHLRGLHPDRPWTNETAAFELFLRAARHGHVEGALEAASTLTRGSLGGVGRDPHTAVILLKRVCERNGHLGFSLREALQAYTHGSRAKALLGYAMLAEAGLSVAQSNAAHLCESLQHPSACQHRYYNYSTFHQAPHPSGFLKMGDHHSQAGDVTEAISMYSRAALAGSPQGMYNLAILIEEGHSVPQNILDQMEVSAEDQAGVMETLLLRCRELEELDVSPCSLTLLRVHMQRAWGDLCQSRTHLTAACGIIYLLVLLVAVVLVQSLLDALLPISTHPSEDARRLLPINHEIQGSGLEESDRRGGPWLSAVPGATRRGAPQNGRPLQEPLDWVITLTGVCLYALCTLYLSHMP